MLNLQHVPQVLQKELAYEGTLRQGARIKLEVNNEKLDVIVPQHKKWRVQIHITVEEKHE